MTKQPLAHKPGQNLLRLWELQPAYLTLRQMFDARIRQHVSGYSAQLIKLHAQGIDLLGGRKLTCSSGLV